MFWLRYGGTPCLRASPHKITKTVSTFVEPGYWEIDFENVQIYGSEENDKDKEHT